MSALRLLAPAGAAVALALAGRAARAGSAGPLAPLAARDTIVAAPTGDSTAVAAPSVAAALAAALPAEGVEAVLRMGGGADEPVRVVVSLRERRLWLLESDTVRFTTPVAVGRDTERALARPGGGHVRFATPAGRFTVERRDSMPQWGPPDWHYAEQARRRGRRLVRLGHGGSYTASDGTVDRLTARDGREITVDGAIVVPPLGTSARRYARVLGPRRLALGGELGIHGTSDPTSIGKAVVRGAALLRGAARGRRAKSRSGAPRGMVDRHTYATPGLHLLGNVRNGALLLDTRSLVTRDVPSLDADSTGFHRLRLLGVAPDGRRLVFFARGVGDPDWKAPGALESYDVDTGRSTCVPIDRAHATGRYDRLFGSE